MADVPGDPDDSGQGEAESRIVTTTIAPDPETAEYEFLAAVADLEEVAIEDLPSLYDRLGHFVENLYRDPPAPETGMELAFSYAGYRVRLDQDGKLTLIDVKHSTSEE